jgi:tripartite-type tricarboxylate transporter receptor subunit TctC
MKLLGMVWTVAASMLAAACAHQDYPTRLVHIVVSYPLGSSIDYLGRLFAPKLGEMLGRQFIVDKLDAAVQHIAVGRKSR